MLVKFVLIYTLLTASLFTTVKGQIKTVTLDYQNNNFNNNNPLPAETYFEVKGAVNPLISIVRLDILKSNRSHDTLYTASWRRPFGNQSQDINIPVRYKLRGSEHYRLAITYYRSLNDSEKIQFARAVRGNLDAYINSALEVNASRVSFRSTPRRMLSDMDQIVYNAFTFYKNGLFGSFPGFSDLVKNKLAQINDTRLRNARYNIHTTEEENKQQVRQRYASRLSGQLLDACMNEVLPYINNQLAVMQDSREFPDYPTEETRSTLAINVGYGAVYLSGGWGDLSYDAAPYAGVSFPLGNNQFNRFMGNASISAGVFLRNFKDEHDQKITGPVVGRPFYLGLGYKVFRFVRINGGLVATASKKSSLQHVQLEDVKLRPFVGLSAELNLWLGTGRK